MNTRDKLSTIQILAAKRILAFLSSNDSMNTVNGINLLNETYKTVLENMKAEQDAFVGVKFTLFNDVVRTLKRRLRQLPIRETENTLSIQTVRNILLVSVLTRDDSTISSLQDFMMELGGCISFRKNSGEVHNSYIWGEIFRYLLLKGGYYFSDDIHDASAREKYIKYLHVLAFDYYCGLLRSGITDILKQDLYGSFVRNITIDSRHGAQAKYSLFLAMAVQAFAFYIAEKAESVTTEEREAANSLIHDDYVRECFYLFMNKLTGSSEITNILSRDFAEEFERFLCRYEILPHDGKSHLIISGNTATEFFMFFTGYLAMLNNSMGMLDKALDMGKARYYFNLEQRNKTTKVFTDLFSLIDNKHDIQNLLSGEYMYDRNVIKARELYDFISIWLRDKEIISADIVQECHAQEPKLDDYVRASAEKRLVHDFAALSKMPSSPAQTITLHAEVLHVSILTHMEHDKGIIDSSIMYVSTNLLLRIIDELKQCNNFMTVAFSSVDEYLETLRAYNISLLIGDEYMINNSDLTDKYEEFQKLKDALKDYKHSYIPMMPSIRSAIAVQDDVLGIKYDYIIAKIVPPSDDEISKATKHEEGSYRYGSEDFKFMSLEELRDYVKKRFRIITVEVKAEIMIKTTASTSGFIIEPFLRY